jgi:DNA polymerase IIIc chi subunit
MENEAFFDLGDNTALVCIDNQQFQKLVVPQMIDIGYKVHLGLFEEDVLLKLKTYSYDVILVHENFKGSKPENNPILREIVNETGAQRRAHFVVLLSQRFATNDAMSAFVQSVDQIVNVSDLANLKPVLRRGVAQYRELYTPFNETVKAVQAL